MKNNMDKRYLDANIFIQGILREDKKFKDVILKIASKEFVGVTSVLSWDELVFNVSKFLGKDVGNREGNKFFSLPNIEFIDAKKEIILKAQKLVEKYSIKPRDAIHCATALFLGVKEIVTEDSDFDKVSELIRIDPGNI